MTTPRVTIRDVAQAAGVSPTTVSHVLNGRGRVGAKTRSRVEEEARRLGYRPNPVATNLRRNVFGSVGLVLPPRSLNYAFYGDLMVGASEVLFEEGVALSLIPPTAGPDAADGFAVDGVIIAEPRTDDPVLQRFWSSGRPLVLCEGAAGPLRADAWAVDSASEESIAGVLDHLSAAGARRLAAVVVDPVTWWGHNVASAIDGWEGTRGQQVRRGTIPFGVSPGAARGEIRRLLADGWVDGLLVCHEGLGAAAIGAAERLGRRVPDDLLVACSVDGPDLLTVDPTVTALDLRPRAMGRAAAALLLERPDAQGATVAPELRIRASTTR